jgi:hypothetical protein
MNSCSPLEIWMTTKEKERYSNSLVTREMKQKSDAIYIHHTTKIIWQCWVWQVIHGNSWTAIRRESWYNHLGRSESLSAKSLLPRLFFLQYQILPLNRIFPIKKTFCYFSHLKYFPKSIHPIFCFPL